LQTFHANQLLMRSRRGFRLMEISKSMEKREVVAPDIGAGHEGKAPKQQLRICAPQHAGTASFRTIPL
jgi:hypothetical protein